MVADCSIIIPAYNAETTITNTLDSIEINILWKHQIEVIVVDDGSTDNNYAIVSAYAKKNRNIIVIKQKNSGVSAARNNGIAKAKGKYIFFLDSDDTLHREALEKMIRIADEKKVDLVIADFINYYVQNDERVKMCSGVPYNRVLDEENKRIIYYRCFIGDTVGLSTSCNKLFRSSIIINNCLRFDEQRTHGEDWAFCIGYIQQIALIYAIDDIAFEYWLDGTQTHSKYKSKLAYSLINGHQIAEGLNDRYLHLDKTSIEYMEFMKRFYYQIIGYLRFDISDKEKETFLRQKEVKKCLSYLNSIDINNFRRLDFSRRDRFCMYLLYYGLYKTALKCVVAQ